jgi:hypothetical protein
MNRRWIASLFLLAAAAVWESPACRAQAVVDLSVNVFPTVLANPNGGGTWNIVAKTSGGSPNAGIAAISVYLHNINTAGITVEPDLNSILDGDGPFNGVFNGAVNILYGQDISTGPPLPPPLVGGVGMPAMSDGPDPLGDLFWDGATKIFSGTYSGVVPSYGTELNTMTGANVLANLNHGSAAIAATVNKVVRVQVPEPASLGLAAIALGGVALTLRSRRARTHVG